jgi:hypothetical protein
MIAYFSLYKSNDEKYAGGLLIISENGIPVSFKYTEPFTPSEIQKIIYGDNIKNYLAYEILKNEDLFKPYDVDIIFVDDIDLLNYVVTDKILVHIIELSLSRSFEIKENEGVIPLHDNKSLKFYASKVVDSNILKRIKYFIDKYDIFEPFERLKEALVYICLTKED